MLRNLHPKDAFKYCLNLNILFIKTHESSCFIEIEPFPNVKEIVIHKIITSIQNASWY